ncbi:flagellar motor switch protein FliM [Edaphosphingomonas haloaromaticamans]|uniref:Flagellar motor switch protein FliM n=1 Tax=Edaphosphingomonas haloaromaticamans TaxID=653954 RepID=A0A1S1HJD3_9SPHN|nr:FliM/FliN family flagellar motor switch protein [Sphingomonas haloaromaticamans]OHT21323.1 Flagellar motor switch protein FliM [Sphingomonas haloaromaticamans]
MTDDGKSLLGDDALGALMAELTEVDDAGGGNGAVRDSVVRPYTFGQDGYASADRLSGLARMAERLARHLRSVIEPFAGTKVQVAAEHHQTMLFDRWRAELPSFSSISLYRLRPLKGGVLAVIEPEFVTAMVDAFYGGSGVAVKHRAREFTPTEERLLGRLTDGIMEGVASVWSDVGSFLPSFVSRETNAAYASLVRADEPVVVQRFIVTPGTGRSSVVAIVYPLGSLRPYESQLAAKVHADPGPVDGEWRGRLARALTHVRLPVRSVLAQPELTVVELMALKPGDVIPITLAPKVPLIVANRRLAYGTIGEQEGRAALMVEHVEQGTMK